MIINSDISEPIPSFLAELSAKKFKSFTSRGLTFGYSPSEGYVKFDKKVGNNFLTIVFSPNVLKQLPQRVVGIETLNLDFVSFSESNIPTSSQSTFDFFAKRFRDKLPQIFDGSEAKNAGAISMNVLLRGTFEFEGTTYKILMEQSNPVISEVKRPANDCYLNTPFVVHEKGLSPEEFSLVSKTIEEGIPLYVQQIRDEFSEKAFRMIPSIRNLKGKDVSIQLMPAEVQKMIERAEDKYEREHKVRLSPRSISIDGASLSTNTVVKGKSGEITFCLLAP